MHQDLISQVKRLARLDPRRPKQANLRRAVSAAYYALFHYLADQACRMAVGTQQAQAPYRQVLVRAFVHGNMKAACDSFAGGTLKKAILKALPSGFAVPIEIKQIAGVFSDLQAKRHDADYDLTVRFSRSNVLLLVREAETAIKQFNALSSASAEKKFFLACLLAWKALVNR